MINSLKKTSFLYEARFLYIRDFTKEYQTIVCYVQTLASVWYNIQNHCQKILI